MPSACSVIAASLPTPGRAIRPLVPKLVSRLPSVLKRAMPMSLLVPFHILPAARILPSAWTSIERPKSKPSPSVLYCKPVPLGTAKVGASFAALTTRLAVSLALLNAPVPGVVTTYCPALPLDMSQARKVMAALNGPLSSPNGTRRIRWVGPSSRPSVLVALLSRLARIVSQVLPPSRLYCQVPRLASTASMAIASTAPSLSVIEPSTTRVATETPVGLVAFSKTAAKAGDTAALSTGAATGTPGLTVADNL